jgi:hypothetical protein
VKISLLRTPISFCPQFLPLLLLQEDLIVIETFLHRRLDLEGMVRLNTAIRLCELIQHKIGLTKLEGQSDEEFLETLARQVRDRARLRT